MGPPIHLCQHDSTEYQQKLSFFWPPPTSFFDDVIFLELLEGFHWPILSVQHFLLHSIAPKQQMNCFKKIEFNSWSFGSVEMAIEKLESDKSWNIYIVTFILIFCKFFIREHPYITSASFGPFLGPPIYLCQHNSTENQQKRPFFLTPAPLSLLT